MDKFTKMEDVALIYHNSFGLAFRWKSTVPNAEYHKIQIVFKNMGFYLLQEEILLFAQNINAAKFFSCKDCSSNHSCRNILLKSPLEKMDIAVNAHELNQISDLIEGTLFHLNLQDYIHGCGMN